MRPPIFLLLVLLPLRTFSQAQDPIEKGGIAIDKATRMQFMRIKAATNSGVDSIAVPVYRNGVHLRIGYNNSISCDSAISTDANTLACYGHVTIAAPGRKLTGDAFIYDILTLKGTLKGNVVDLNTRDVTQTADLDFSHGDYIIRSKN